MIKYLLIFALGVYISRKFLFAPIPGSSRHEEKKAKSKPNNLNYTEYEEID